MSGVTCLAAPVDSSPAPELGRRVTTVIRPDVRTGKLVRSVVITPHAVPAPKTIAPVIIAPRPVTPVAPPADSASKPAVQPMPRALGEAVARIAAEQELPASLIHSVIQVESNYNPNALSPKGAQGLMQLIPSTARRFGVVDAFDPVDNIQGGARYLKYLLDLYGGDRALALAAYNAGEGAVARFGGIPPYPETVNYVHSVAAQLRKNAAAAKPPVAPADSAGQSAAKNPTRIVEIRQPDGSVRYVSQ